MPAGIPCEACLEALQVIHGSVESEVDRRWWKIPHHNTYKELAESSRSCNLCRRLLSEARCTTTETGDLKSCDDFGFEPRRTNDASISMTYEWCNQGIANRIDFLFVFGLLPSAKLQDGSEDMSDHEIQTKGLIWTSEETIIYEAWLPIVKSWIHDCLSNEADKHHMCSPVQRSRRLPTRLILIQTEDSNRYSASLVETTGMDISTEYTTLSHRWPPSGERPLETTKSSIHQYLKGIPLGKISKTYLDAMRLTSTFGKRYIWIDSLCIIQDSKEDWEYEATRMKDVYGGSWLNIAALDLGGCCLKATEPAWRFRYSQESADFVAIRKVLTGLNHPLNNRGWVLQEIELAPRVLFCSNSHFSWQCLAGSRSAEGISLSETLSSTKCKPPDLLHLPLKDLQLPYGSLIYPDQKKIRSLADKAREDLLDFRREFFLNQWPKFVRRYSGIDFSYESDRLPACAGIMSFYQQHLKMEQVLGVWKDLAGHSLSWVYFERDTFDAKLRRQGSALPSWSWFSLGKARVLQNIDLYDICIHLDCLTVQKLDAKWEGEDYTSKLESAELIVKGIVLKVVPNSSQNSWLGGTSPETLQFTTTVIGDPVQFTANYAFPPRIDGIGSEASSSDTPVLEHTVLLTSIEDKLNPPLISYVVLEEVSSNPVSALRRFSRIGAGYLRGLEVDGLSGQTPAWVAAKIKEHSGILELV